MMIDALAASLSERLLAASLQAAVVVPLVWVSLRVFRTIPASVQAAIWWLVTARFVIALLPVPAVVIPVLPADSAPAVERALAYATPIPAPAADSQEFAGSWRSTIVMAWLALIVAQACVLAASFRRHRTIVRQSVPLEGDAADELARLAALLRLRRMPRLRASADVHVPLVAGVLRPVVIVPAQFTTRLSATERTMTLAHELMHVRRLDLALGWIPALAERLFFFHPLARVAAREYVVARESACDAAVLRALDVAPAEYGRMLLRFGVRSQAAPLAAGAGAFSTSSLKRRLEMLEHPESRIGVVSRLILTAAACALLPVQLGARPEPASQPHATPAPVAISAAVTRRVVTPALPDDGQLPQNSAGRASPAAQAAPQQRAQDAAPPAKDGAPGENAREELRRLQAATAKMLEMMKHAADARWAAEMAGAATAAADLARKAAAERAASEQSDVERRVLTEEAMRRELEVLRGQIEALRSQMALLQEQRNALEEAHRRFMEHADRMRRELDAR